MTEIEYLESEKFIPDLLSEDPRAFEKAFHTLHKYLFGQLVFFSYGMIHDQGEAEDIVTNVFFQLYKIRSRQESFKNIKALLYMSTRNASLNFIRFKQRKSTHHKEFIRRVDEDINLVNAQIHGAVLFDLDTNKLTKALNQLSEEFRSVFDLLYFKGLSYQQAADALGIPVNSLKTRRRLGLAKLRSHFFTEGQLIAVGVFLIVALVRLMVAISN